MQLTQATILDDVYKTVSPEPLMKPDEFKAFYKGELNETRGGDKVAHIALNLRRAYGGVFYKCFMMGHPGVGKSTELTRLISSVHNQYRAIRFSATSDLDAGGFKAFDVLLLMMIRVVEETQKETGSPPSRHLLEEVQRWYAQETRSFTDNVKTDIGVSAGVGPKVGGPLEIVLGLFANIKGEIKYTSDRKKEVIEYRLHRLSILLDLVNRLIADCSRLLKEATGCEWLFVGEDFDKPGILPEQTENLFINYANIFKELQTNLIFNIPISLVYSERAAQLPFSGERIHCVLDTPVFKQDHTVHEEGRAALRAVLEARIAPDLFEDDLMLRFIVASGGNLRDLFQMVSQATDNAILRKDSNGKISRVDAESAINELRAEYVRRLGESPFDEDTGHPITYDVKALLLKNIYDMDKESEVPSPILYSLLRARAVQEFNGTKWFGIHPLVVDILTDQKRITRPATGAVPGGTR